MTSNESFLFGKIKSSDLFNLNHSTKKKIAMLIFIWSALLFFINLQYDFSDNIDLLLFWLSILFMICTVLYQIFFLENKRFILFEIFIIFLLLHLVYQIGYFGLRGTDSYIDYNFLKSIINNQAFSFGKDDMAGWPLLHLFTSTLTYITKIHPFILAKFLPSVITSIIVLPIYLLVLRIYKEKRVALFSCLIFGTVPQFVHFEAIFVRETFAIFFFVLFFYILYTAKKTKDVHFRLLSIILIPVVIFSHHFTSFMLIIFLGIFILTSKVIPFLYRKNKYMKLNEIRIKTIFLVIVAAILAYWLYLAVFILDDFFSIFYEATGAKELVTYAERIDLGTPIVTLKGNIMYYGFFFFQGILCLILLLKFLIIKNNQKIEDTAFSLFLYFSLFYGFLALFVLGSILFPDRFLPFGWMVGLIPLSGLLFSLKKKVLKRVLFVILISFLIYNIYTIDTNYYTGNPGLGGGVSTEKEYCIANEITFPETYYGYVGIFGAVFDIQDVKFTSGAGKNPIFIKNFSTSSDVAVINEGDYLLSLQNIKQKMASKYYLKVIETLELKNQEYVDKLCDLGDIYVISGSK